jgi:hypothetical protein
MSVLSLVAALALSASGQRVGTPSITSDLSQSRVTATGSTTARSLRDRAADTVNVKDYGAKGDGVTDDTGAIQAAITALPTGSPGGGTVFLPGGTYNIGTTGLSVPAGKRGVRLVGASRIATYIRYSGTGYALTVGASTADTGDFHLEDLTIDLASGPAGAGGLKVIRSQDGTIRRVWVQGRVSGSDSGTGIYFDGTGNWVGNYTLDLVRVNGNFAKGVYCDGPGVNTANHFDLRQLSIARTTVKPGTGSIGLHWAANAGDGAMLVPDVENYDTGYQIDGRYMNGPIRSENNTVAVAFGAASTSNTLWHQGFSNTTTATYAVGQSFNSLFDPAGFNLALNNGATNGAINYRENTDHGFDMQLRAGVATDQTVRLVFMEKGGNPTHRFGKNQFNQFVINDQAGFTRLSIGGYFVANDGVDIRGIGTGAIKLNVGDVSGQGTGGTTFGDGAGNVKGWIDSSGVVHLGSTTGPEIRTGAGAPSADAPIGSLYLRTDGGAGTSLYVKQVAGAGAGNWGAK